MEIIITQQMLQPKLAILSFINICRALTKILDKRDLGSISQTVLCLVLNFREVFYRHRAQMDRANYMIFTEHPTFMKSTPGVNFVKYFAPKLTKVKPFLSFVCF